MKVDPAGIVSHLRSAIRTGDRDVEDYLSGEIVRHIEQTDALEEEVKQLRRAGYVLAMALQSPEWKRLDEEAEEAARRFLAHVTEAELGAFPDTPETDDAE